MDEFDALAPGGGLMPVTVKLRARPRSDAAGTAGEAVVDGWPAADAEGMRPAAAASWVPHPN